MDDSVEWERWLVECPGNAPAVVIEAPSKGVAIEYYMASHGILSTNVKVKCEPTTRVLYGSKEAVIQTLGGVDAEKIRQLEAFHVETADLERRYAIADNVTDALQSSFSKGPFLSVAQALWVRPDRDHALLCEIPWEGPTIIKHYWDGTIWNRAGDLSITAKNKDDPFSPVRYGFPGIFELAGIPILPFMCGRDSIVDNNGDGRTVYVHRCALCGRFFARNLMALVPVLCEQCHARERTQRRIVL